jgi:hypothetical protein
MQERAQFHARWGIRLACAAFALVRWAVTLCALSACAPTPRVPAPTHTPADHAVEIAPGVRVDRARRTVSADGTVALTQGFLEQLVCTPSTRVHESLISIDASPREVHAALLLTGLEPGAPGRWQEIPDGTGAWKIDRVRPTGPRVDVSVRWRTSSGETREVPILQWVRRVDASGDPSSPPSGTAPQSPTGHLVFSGSRIRANSPSMGPGEHYVADFTGSVVGLVTFGDEVIAYDDVIADKVDVDPAAWVAWTERMPPEGTRVELLIRADGSSR